MFTVKCFNSSVIFIIKRGNKRNLWDCSTDNTNNTRNNNNQNDSSPVTFPLPYWPCWFWNVPGLLPLHCFLLPLLTLVHPGLLPIHPLRFFVHVASCSAFTAHLFAIAHLNWWHSLPCHFIFLSSTALIILCLIMHFILFIISPHKNVNLMRTEIFIYLVAAAYQWQDNAWNIVDTQQKFAE